MFADRVAQTTTTTGTGTYDLIDPPTGQYLSAVASVGTGGRLTYIVQMDGVWEICWGVVTAGSPATLTRNLIRSSTGALINWTSGTKSVSSIGQSDLTRFGARGNIPASAGTANAQTVTHITPMRFRTTGVQVAFRPGNTNTGATTLNVDGTGAAAVVRPDGSACVGGELRANYMAEVNFDGTSWRLVALPALPLPVATAGSGIGQVTNIVSPSAGAAVVAPTPGTWWCTVYGFNSPAGTWNFQVVSDVYAGGATIISAPGVIFAGSAIRIA
jgi:hypothetical protein